MTAFVDPVAGWPALAQVALGVEVGSLITVVWLFVTSKPSVPPSRGLRAPSNVIPFRDREEVAR